MNVVSKEIMMTGKSCKL